MEGGEAMDQKRGKLSWKIEREERKECDKNKIIKPACFSFPQI